MPKRATPLPTTQEEPWESSYDHWRHGGWYTDARYPSGACGCVSSNYDDKKWRIACGPFHGLTFSTRKDAANAERAMTLAMCEADPIRVELLAALRGLMQHCVTTTGMPDVGKGRTPEQQAAFDAARKAIVNAKKYWDEDDSVTCDECNRLIPSIDGEFANEHHAESCSLHPAACVG